jgi:hypothetical protein
MSITNIKIKNNSGEFQSIFPITIEQGGTNAENLSDAQYNLGITDARKIATNYIDENSDNGTINIGNIDKINNPSGVSGTPYSIELTSDAINFNDADKGTTPISIQDVANSKKDDNGLIVNLNKVLVYTNDAGFQCRKNGTDGVLYEANLGIQKAGEVYISNWNKESNTLVNQLCLNSSETYTPNNLRTGKKLSAAGDLAISGDSTLTGNLICSGTTDFPLPVHYGNITELDSQNVGLNSFTSVEDSPVYTGQLLTLSTNRDISSIDKTTENDAGGAAQLAFDSFYNSIYHRAYQPYSDTEDISGWGDWYKLLDTNNCKDYIISVENPGDNVKGGWLSIKFANGFAICALQQIKDINTNIQWTSGYRTKSGEGFGNVDFPFEFANKQIPYISAQLLDNGNNWCWLMQNGYQAESDPTTYKHLGEWLVYRPAVMNTAGMRACFICIGFWK